MKTNKWKMSLLVWSAMFPFSTAMNYALAQFPFTAHWPVVARTFFLTCLLVPYMVFVALPFLSRYFQKWLQINPDKITAQPGQPDNTLANQSAKIHPETGKVEPREHYPGLQQTGLMPDQTPAPFQLNRIAS